MHYQLSHEQQTPNYISPKQLPNLLTNKSKQLITVGTLITKCIKIASMFSIEQASMLENRVTEGEGLHAIDFLLDAIAILVRVQSATGQQFKIEEVLQKQESLNRSLIKKELEFREEFKTMAEELLDLKTRNTKLSEYVAKLNEELRDKDLTILHVKNELKACQKERRLLDETKFEFTLDTKLKSYLSKDLEIIRTTRSRTAHRRRKSEDVSRKVDKNSGVKKRGKDKVLEKENRLEREKRKSLIFHSDRK